MPRGRGRGRTQTNFKATPRNQNDTIPVHQRLGTKVSVYNPKAVDRLQNKKYKFVRNNTITSSIATLPGDGKIKMLAKKFIKSYYEIFDLPGRTNLQSLYSPDAFFSFSAAVPLPTQGRNLLLVPPENRLSLLVHANDNIARQLALYPNTEHLVEYLTIDVPYYIANPLSVICMHIVITGVFKDTVEEKNPLRAFTRIFIVKQTSVDKMGEPIYVIFNDLFMLQTPTPDQIKRYHHDSMISKRINSNTPTNRANTSTPSTNNSDSLSRAQENLLQTMMTKTRMNRRGTKQLLDESKWDENSAMAMFTSLSETGQIPQDYFIP